VTRRHSWRGAGAAWREWAGGRRGGGALRGGGRASRGERQLAGDIYLGLPRRGLWRVTATPRSVVRQTLPRHLSAASVVATSSSCRATMHSAAQVFRRAMAIGAAKSVSFEEKNSVRFKNS